MKKQLFIISLILILTSIKLYSQDEDTLLYNYTNKLAYTEDFSGAIKMYNQMLSFDPKNPVFYYKLGFAYLNTIDKTDSAIYYFKKAKNFYTKNYRSEVSPFEIDFYLARAYRLNKNIDSSLIILENLRKESANKKFITSINNELDITKKSITNLFTVDDLDSVINSNYSEHSPVYSQKNNILIFTSRKYNANSKKFDDGQYDEDIYYSDWKNGTWSSPKIMKQFSTPNNEATASIQSQGDFLLLYKDDENGNIYSSKFVKGNWTKPVALPRPINSRFRETHASMTSDKKQIFFTSDRPGGYGGLDIWTSYLDNEGNWSKPVNLGDAINTPQDEDSPNISADNQTLYFSSNGRQGFGGFDIFKSQRTEFNTWTIAKNLGYPINSVGDDIFFTQIANTDKAFYTSYRYGGKGNADIFVVYLDTNTTKRSLVNYGFILDSLEQPIEDINIVIINHQSGKKTISKPSTSGKFVFVTESKTTYTLKVFHKNEIVFVDSFTTSDTLTDINFYKKIIIPLKNE